MKCKHIVIYVSCGLDLLMCLCAGSCLCIQQYFVIRFASEVVELLVHCALSLVDWRPTFRDRCWSHCPGLYVVTVNVKYHTQ